MTKMYLSCNFNQRFECTYIMQVNSNINLLGTQKTEVGVGFFWMCCNFPPEICYFLLQTHQQNCLNCISAFGTKRSTSPVDILQYIKLCYKMNYKLVLQRHAKTYYYSGSHYFAYAESFLCTSSPRRLFVLFLNEFSLYVCVFNNIMYHTPMYYY